jgi:2,3-bisphosphoglycerate-independent phosphoglycerate mutase
VPLAIIGVNKKLKEGRLADIAPTMLDIMGLEKPEEMTGESLLEN